MGVPELPLLSTTDISQTSEGWVCDKLDVEQLLHEGETFVYELTKVIRWLSA